MRRARAGIWMLAAVGAACEFGEITIPDTEPIVVVQAVMRPDQPRQWILVEETFTGVQPLDSGGTLIPGERPTLPVARAEVVVRNRSYVSDPCGATVFRENVVAPFLPQTSGVYWGPDNCPTMRPGDTLDLRVRTADGVFVTGSTVVPGVDGFVLGIGAAETNIPGAVLTLNRDRDTVLAWAAAPRGRTLQLEVRRPTVTGSSAPAFWIAVDSTAIAVPGDLPDILTGFQEDTSGIPEEFPPVFTAGAVHRITVGLGDQVYFDYVRSGNIPPSGRGFINHLEGGMGVFGSMIAATGEVRVIGDLDDEREGTYRLSGSITGVPVDVALELYVASAGRDTTKTTTFVDGEWVLGTIGVSADGVFVGDSLDLLLQQVSPEAVDSVESFVVRGMTEPGRTRTVRVYDANGGLLDSLALERPAPPAQR